jgi:O-antigen ligase
MTVSVVLALLLSIYTPILIKQVYNEIASTNSTPIEQKASPKPQETQQPQTIGRGYDIKKDISNRRFEIWLSGLEIFLKNPIVGVSRENIVAYASEHMPETYIVNNSQMDFDSMHNLYVDVIVSQGLLGFIPFMLFLLLSAISIIRNLPLLFSKSDNTLMIASILLTVVTSTLVITEIIYVDSPISTVFWSSLGYINHICLLKKK